MHRRKDMLRVGATALGVAVGLMALASTAQTPDGYIHASFGGPLDLFSSGSSDVMSIGDGTNDTTELAALLNGARGPVAGNGTAGPSNPVAYPVSGAPTIAGPGSVAPTRGPVPLPAVGKDPAMLSGRPVVDAQGRIDCTGAVSCQTDPNTNVTTLTYADGVVAVVRTINDLTVVAYRTITDVLPDGISTRLPAVPSSAPALASAAPAPASAPAASSAPPSPIAEATGGTATNVGPGPTAANPTNASRRPRIDVTPPPKDYTSGSTGSTPPPSSAPKFPQKVKEVVGGVVDTVKGVVGKVIGPGAATKPDSTGKSNGS